MNNKGFLGNLIGGFILLIIGFELYPRIKDAVLSIPVNETSSSASTLIQIVPLFFALIVLISAISMVYSGFKNSGMFGSSEDEPQEDESSDDEEYNNEIRSGIKKITSTKIEPPKKPVISSIESKEEVKPIFTNKKNKFEVKSKYD